MSKNRFDPVPINPVRIVPERSLIYDLQGHPFLPQDVIDYKLPEYRILLTVPVTENGVSSEALEEAKAFARRYFIHTREALPHYTRPSVDMDKPAWAGTKETLEKKLDAITVETVNRDLQQDKFKSLSSRIYFSVDNTERVFTPTQMAAENAKLIDNIMCERMPEWLQILTFHSGLYLFTQEESGPNYEYVGGDVGDTIPYHKVPVVYVENPFVDDALDMHPPVAETLREELLHVLQDQFGLKRFLGMAVRTDLPKHEMHAVETLCEAMARNPDHPAAQLIRKTESRGGSAVIDDYKNNLRVRMQELMVDIYEAEIRLRSEEHKTKEDTERELKTAFGDEVYELSRRYVNAWIDEAAKIIEPSVGHQKAEALRRKWKEEPFTHPITSQAMDAVTELPRACWHYSR